MGRLLKTAIALVVVLVVLFGGMLAYRHLAGKDSVADNQPPLSGWRTISVGTFSAKLPHQPGSASATTGGVTTTMFTLGADLDSFIVSVAQAAQAPTLDTLVHTTATSSKLDVASTTPATVGGKPAELYRFVGTAGGQPVSAFGAAITNGGQAILIQYDVGGHPTATPAFLQKVLGTVSFSS